MLAVADEKDVILISQATVVSPLVCVNRVFLAAEAVYQINHVEVYSRRAVLREELHGVNDFVSRKKTHDLILFDHNVEDDVFVALLSRRL